MFFTLKSQTKWLNCSFPCTDFPTTVLHPDPFRKKIHFICFSFCLPFEHLYWTLLLYIFKSSEFHFFAVPCLRGAPSGSMGAVPLGARLARPEGAGRSRPRGFPASGARGPLPRPRAPVRRWWVRGGVRPCPCMSVTVPGTSRPLHCACCASLPEEEPGPQPAGQEEGGR